jgi:hypothetical protein
MVTRIHLCEEMGNCGGGAFWQYLLKLHCPLVPNFTKKESREGDAFLAVLKVLTKKGSGAGFYNYDKFLRRLAQALSSFMPLLQCPKVKA